MPYQVLGDKDLGTSVGAKALQNLSHVMRVFPKLFKDSEPKYITVHAVILEEFYNECRP